MMTQPHHHARDHPTISVATTSKSKSKGCRGDDEERPITPSELEGILLASAVVVFQNLIASPSSVTRWLFAALHTYTDQSRQMSMLKL